VTEAPAAAQRRRSLTLRTKLVALLVALLTVAFLLVALITTIALRSFLQNRLDQQLRTAADRFSVTLEHGTDVDADNDAQFDAVSGQAAGTLGARVADGKVIAAAVVGHGSQDPTTAPGSEARAVIARLHPDGSPHTVHLPGLGGYRLIVTRGAQGDLLVTGLPTREIEHTIARLVGIEGVVFGVTLLLVGVCGAVLIRLALRPLNRMAGTATQVADLALSSGAVSMPERVPEPDTRTEVGALSTAFDRMLEHVETSLRRRQASEDRLRRFIADASHELRTPVAVVRAHAELATRTSDSLPPEVERSLSRIAAESERMGHLVDDLLLLARLDSGRPLAREEVDVTRVVLDTLSDAKVAAPDHRWRLDLPAEPVTAVGDENALHQVLANLLGNARIHTPAGTTVLAAAHRLPDRGVEIVVSDDGPGVPAAMQADVFERFVRADDTRSASTGSSGLGLAIVDAIVRGLGGTIDMHSVPGDTRFTIRLPVLGAEPASADQAVNGARRARARRQPAPRAASRPRAR
jgi:two-component system OmpR family sensor kinase